MKFKNNKKIPHSGGFFQAGKVTWMVRKDSRGLSARIFPLWAVTMLRAMDRPRPYPPVWLLREGSVR